MTTQYRTFQVVIPAGTLQTAPVRINTRFEPFTVSQVTVRIPPGPLGQMGFRIATSGVQVVPWNAGSWIVANDEFLEFPATNWPDSGDWAVFGYNTGVFAHTIYVTFYLDPVTGRAVPPVTITTADLSTIDTSPVQPSVSGSVVLAGTGADFNPDAGVP